MTRAGHLCAATCATFVTMASCADSRTLPSCIDDPPATGPRIETGGDPVILAAGDVAEPTDLSGAVATARLLHEHDGIVAMLGDGAQGIGQLDEYLDGYASTWGPERWRTRPAPGNHEYLTPNAGPYFAYFCAAAGMPFEGYYSYDAGAWHVVVLNSARADSDTGPDAVRGSPQEQWLRDDLAAHPAKCTLVYWHHPIFASGWAASTAMSDVWSDLHDAGVELVLNGHSHVYERFAPLDASGGRDDLHGTREIIVGTGGAFHDHVGTPTRNSEVLIEDTWGVIELTLHPASYDWVFHATSGRDLDRGSSPCH